MDRSSSDVERPTSSDIERQRDLGFTSTERRDYESATLRYTTAAHIANYIDNAQMPAKELAQRIRKSRSWVSKLLSGRQNATLDTLAEVAWALGAKWEVDLVSADRGSTPAENDPPPPAWAVQQPITSILSLAVSSTAQISRSMFRSSFESVVLTNVDFQYIHSTVVNVNVIAGSRWLDSLTKPGVMSVIIPSVQEGYLPSTSPTIITEIESEL